MWLHPENRNGGGAGFAGVEVGVARKPATYKKASDSRAIIVSEKHASISASDNTNPAHILYTGLVL